MTKIAFMFPGQGSMEAGMGREIANAVPEAMAVYDEASDAAAMDLKELCFDRPVDDLVDTGTTARIVRNLLPQAHFATVYAKPMGRPLVDTFITEVSQDTWIYFPWDTGLVFQPPLREGGA